MSQFVTTFDKNGKTVFSSKIPEQQNPLKFPAGTMTMLYTTHALPNNISTEADIDKYAEDRVKGLSSPVPANGTNASIICITPNGATPFRRTISQGTFYILEGAVNLHLDSEEERVLKAGDVVVMRAAKHWLKNVTPNDGWAKLLVFAQHVEPVEIDGKVLGPEWN